MAMASLAKQGSSSLVAGGYPSPLWQFLLTVAGRFHLDPLLSEKVLSLIFSCLAILTYFLVANELLRDYVMAFCAVLAVAMQGWFIQIAPSGSALSAAIALAMAVVFFMLRNEYVVASFLLGLSTLVYWQAVFLFIPLCADIWINSVSKQRASHVMLSVGLAYVCALLPWVAFAWTSHENVIPVMLRTPELPPLSYPLVLTRVILGSLGLWGLALSFPAAKRESLRAHGGPLLFMILLFALGGALHSEAWYAGLPLVVVYALSGLGEVLRSWGREHLIYSASFVLTGLLLICWQHDYFRENRPSMAVAIARAQDLRAAAGWIRTNSPARQNICAEHPVVVEYYAERAVTSAEQSDGSTCDLVVTSRGQMPGYEKAFSPQSMFDAVPMQRYAVWRKK